MAELTSLIVLTDHQDATVAWAAFQALKIAQSRHNSSITPTEAVEALQNLQRQTSGSMADSDVEHKVIITDTITALIAVVRNVP